MTGFLSHHSQKSRYIASIMNTQDMPQISRHVFTKTPYGRRDYTELEIFRQEIELNQLGVHHQPYTINKPGVRLYKSIFYGFCGLFILLGMFVMATNSTFTYAFFNFSIVVKTLVILICALLALASLIMAITMRTEREAIASYARIAKTNLSKLYARRKWKLGAKRFIPFVGSFQAEINALRQSYHEACDLITERKDEVLHLVNRISSIQSIEPQTKEKLFNQAIAEFNDKLTLLVRNFKFSS